MQVLHHNAVSGSSDQEPIRPWRAICVFINIAANVKVALLTAQGNQAHLEPSLEDLGFLKKYFDNL